MSREVHVPKSLISKIFEPFLKSCTSEVRVPWGRVPRGLTVPFSCEQTADILSTNVKKIIECVSFQVTCTPKTDDFMLLSRDEIKALIISFLVIVHSLR